MFIIIDSVSCFSDPHIWVSLWCCEAKVTHTGSHVFPIICTSGFPSIYTRNEKFPSEKSYGLENFHMIVLKIIFYVSFYGSYGTNWRHMGIYPIFCRHMGTHFLTILTNFGNGQFSSFFMFPVIWDKFNLSSYGKQSFLFIRYFGSYGNVFLSYDTNDYPYDKSIIPFDKYLFPSDKFSRSLYVKNILVQFHVFLNNIVHSNGHRS